MAKEFDLQSFVTSLDGPTVEERTPFSRGAVSLGNFQQDEVVSPDLQQEYRSIFPVRSRPVTPTWFDQTIGAFGFGSADVGSNLFKKIGGWIPGDDFIEEWGKDLQQWKDEHPEYAPEEVESAWDLLKNPRALAGRVFGMAPMVLAVAGASFGAGFAGAGALSYMIESQRGYDEAKMMGASEQDANINAQVKGTVFALLDVLPVQNLFSFLRGAKQSVAKAAVARAADLLPKTPLAKESAKFIATQAVFATLNGSADELISHGVYGRPVEDGFLDRRLQDAVGSVAASAVFGLTPKYMKTLQKQKDPYTVKAGEVIDAREALWTEIRKTASQADAARIITVADQIIGNMAQEFGIPMREMYPRVIADDPAAFMAKVGGRGAQVHPQVAEFFQRAYHGTGNEYQSETLVNEGGELRYYPSDKIPDGAKKLVEYPAGRFNLDYMSTGEGQQAYAWGFYLAQNKDIADLYYKGLTSTKELLTVGDEPFDRTNPEHSAARDLASPQYELPRDEALQLLRRNALKRIEHGWGSPILSKEIIRLVDDELNGGKKIRQYSVRTEKSGALYQVDFKPDDNLLLDWDAPMTEQPDIVQKVAEKWGYGVDHKGKYGRPARGEDFYRWAVVRVGRGKYPFKLDEITERGALKPERAVSEALLYAGVRGVRFLDADSRYRQTEQTRNFVAFDPTDIVIETRNGESVSPPKQFFQSSKSGGWERGRVVLKSELENGSMWFVQQDVLPKTNTPAYHYISGGLEGGKISGGGSSQNVGLGHEFYVTNDGIHNYRGELIKTRDEILRDPAKRGRSVENELFGRLLGDTEIYSKTGAKLTSTAWIDPNAGIGQPITNLFEQRGRGTLSTARAIVRFAQDNQALIQALNKPDPSSVVHEMGHVLLQWLPPRLQEVARDRHLFGPMVDPKSRAAHEQFADSWVRYFQEGKAPEAWQRGIFSYLKDTMAKIYGTAMQSGMPIPAEVRAMFDRAVGGRPRSALAEALIQTAVPNRPSILQVAEQVIPQAVINTASKDEMRVVRAVRDAGRSVVRNVASMYRGLVDGLGKVAFHDAQSDIDEYRHSAVGYFGTLFDEAYVEARSSGEVKGLENVESFVVPGFSGKVGWSLFTRMNDRTPFPTNGPNHFLGEIVQDIRKQLGDEYTRAGGVQKTVGGYKLFHPMAENRLARYYIQEFWNVVAGRSGADKQAAAVDAFYALNRKRFKNRSEVEAIFRRATDPSSRTVGELEFSRKFDFVPDVITMQDGRVIPVQDTNIYHRVHRTIDIEARKVAQQRVLGGIKNTEGVRRQFVDFANAVGVSTRITKKWIAEKIVASGMVPRGQIFDAQGKVIPSAKSLKQLAGILRISVDKKQAGEIFQDIQSQVNPQALSPQNAADMDKLMKRLRMVPLGGPDTMYHQLVEAHSFDLREDGFRKIVDLYKREGGNEQDMIDVINLSQGIPIKPMKSTTGSSLLKIGSSILGTLQTSLSAIPNIPQAMVLGPSMFGWKNLIKAYRNVARDPEGTRDMAIVNGAVPRAIMVMAREPGRWGENISQNIRMASGEITQLRKVNEFQLVVTAETAKLWADGLKEGGLRAGDAQKLRDLRLTEKDIDAVRQKKMTDPIFRKIVQNAVATLQYSTESAPFRSKIENWPMMRMVFAYSSYVLGATRSLLSIKDSWSNAAKTRDPKEGYAALKRTSAWIAGAIGAGMLTQLLRAAAKGDYTALKTEDDFERAQNALAEVALLGAAQRMSDAFHYGDDNVDKIIFGMMPQVSAVKNLLGTLLGYGKYGKLDLDDRLFEESKRITPVERGITNYVNSVAYPDASDYQDAIGHVRKFRRTYGEKTSVGAEVPLDPAYYNIFQAVVRNDQDEARRLVKEYMQAAFLRAKEEGRDPMEYVERLRASLLGREPVRISMEKLPLFMRTLPKEKRRQLMRTQARYRALVDRIAPSGF